MADGGEESAYEIGEKQALLLLSQDNEIFAPKKVESYIDTHGQFSIYKLVHDHGYIMSGRGQNLESISNNAGTESITPTGTDMTISLRSCTNKIGGIEVNQTPTPSNSCREDGEKETVSHSQCLRVKKNALDAEFLSKESTEKDSEKMSHSLHPRCLACRNCTLCMLDALGKNSL